MNVVRFPSNGRLLTVADRRRINDKLSRRHSKLHDIRNDLLQIVDDLDDPQIRRVAEGGLAGLDILEQSIRAIIRMNYD